MLAKASQIFTAGLIRCDDSVESSRKPLDLLFEFVRRRDGTDEIHEDFSCERLMGFLTSFEADFNFDFVPLGEKFLRLLFSDIQIMLVDAESQSNALYFSFFLLGFLLLFFFGFLILIFSKVHYFHDRGADIGNNFHKVELLFPGHLEGLLGWHDANLSSAVIDKPDRGNADTFIDSGPRTAMLRLAAKKTSSDKFYLNG